jgi:hypothetical protein
MTESTRIYGAALILKLDGKDVAADLTEAELSFEAEDKDNMTFAQAAAGGSDVGKLKIKAIQSTDTASFWRTVWASAGKRDVPFALAVHGNADPTEDKPHVTGRLDIGPRPALGGAADPKKSYVFDVEFSARVDRELKVATG